MRRSLGLLAMVGILFGAPPASGVSFFYVPNPPAGFPTFALTKGRIVAELDPVTFTILSLSNDRLELAVFLG